MSKLPNITTSIFTVMSKMAAEYNAINLSQGFPNFPVDERNVSQTHLLEKGDKKISSMFLIVFKISLFCKKTKF